MRVPVATVIGKLAAGMSRAEILADFPDLENEDITEALRFAAAAVKTANCRSPVRNRALEGTG